MAKESKVRVHRLSKNKSLAAVVIVMLLIHKIQRNKTADGPERVKAL